MRRRGLLFGFVLTLGIQGAVFAGTSTKTAISTERLHLTFTEHSPLSGLDVVWPRFDASRRLDRLPDAERASLEYDLARESFEAFVPHACKSGVPHGLVVWIGAGGADVPPGWLDVFRRHKLIWISANNTGNHRPVPIRMGLALDAVHNMTRLYGVDESRIYVAGFSGGAAVASSLIRGFPDVFRGGYLLMGYLLYDGRTNDRGQWEAGILGPTWNGPLDRIKKNVRLTILSGEGDPGVWPGAHRADYEALLLDGFEYAGFVEVPRLGHHLPDAPWFETGLNALEAGRRTPPIMSPTVDAHPLPSQTAQANRILTTTRVFLDHAKQGDLPARDKARGYLEQVSKEYPTTPAATKARRLLDELDRPIQATASTGLLHLNFAERSPYSEPNVVLSRMEYSRQSTDMRAFEYDLARLSFEVFVPRSYRPDVPHGLFVWMGVTDVPPAWRDVLARHKLILVVANTRKGRVAVYGQALDAVHNLKKLYSIDENQVYASGFSAGGQMATMMVRGFPEVFRGGLFLMGGYFYHSRETENGLREPTVEVAFPAWKGLIDELKNTTKLVIVKAGNDTRWTAAEGRSDYQALLLDGFTHVSYLEIPGLGHVPPNAGWFEKGVAALDSLEPLTPPVIGPTTDPNPSPSQIAQAQRLLATAQYYLELKLPQVSKEMQDKCRKSYRESARKYLQRVLDEYPTAPVAARARELLSRAHVIEQ
jgi:predicted esterase